MMFDVRAHRDAVAGHEGLRVVIADGHASTRKLLRDMLEQSAVVVCGEAPDAESAVNAVAKHRPEVVLLDVQLPGDAIQAASEITELVPECRMVMLSEHEDDLQLFRALEAGASGYLVTDADMSRLPLVLEGVLKGESALPRTLVTRVVEEFNARGRALDILVGRNPADRLTCREWEVLDLLRQGATTAEMADQLFVSRATVRTHVSAIMRKLHVTDRAAAVRLLEEGNGPANTYHVVS
jgi:DNA-binding NarL/FixJ family response regulator